MIILTRRSHYGYIIVSGIPRYRNIYNTELGINNPGNNLSSYKICNSNSDIP